MRRRMWQRLLTIMAAVVVLVLIIVAAVKISGNLGDYTQQRRGAEQIKKVAGYTLKQVPFAVYEKLGENAFLAVEDNLAGVVNRQGEYVVQPLFTYMNYFDGEWISFQDEYNMGYVYDLEGNELFTYNGSDTQMSEKGIIYTVWTSYQKGIKTELLTGKNPADYNGIRYYNAQTGELIFEAHNHKVTLASASLPDENGMAVAVIEGENEITVYRITKDGYETEVLNYSDSRQFCYTGYLNHTCNLMSEGWLKCGMETEKKEEVLFNVMTGEVVSLPEKYQNTYAVYYDYESYNGSKGLYYGISTLTESEYYGKYPEVMHYAICHGDKVLTEEIYTWITFDENYILAGNETLSHVLDYDGTVLNEFVNMSTAFVDEKLLVYSGIGVYVMDEERNIDKNSLMRNCYYLGPGFIWDGSCGYMILQEE